MYPKTFPVTGIYNTKRHSKQSGSEGLPCVSEGCPLKGVQRPQKPTAVFSLQQWTWLRPIQTLSNQPPSHTSTSQIIPDLSANLSQAELQATAWYAITMHSMCLCACFSMVCISIGPSNSHIVSSECTIQEKEKTTSIPPVYIPTGRISTEQYLTSASA